ncbi:hypothetical protein FICKIIDM_04097 [Xanthomonas citri pv. punicae]|nr:hypothetical protein FICKIIDM_04097 [Xanthomonas citri pv. punicae]
MARRRPRGRTDGAPIAPRAHARGPGRLSCGHHLHRVLCRWRGCVGCQCAQPWHLPVAAACTARYCRRPPPAGQDGFALPDAVPSRIRTQSPPLRWSRPPTWGTIASLSDTPPHAIAHRSSFQAAPLPTATALRPRGLLRERTVGQCRTSPALRSATARVRPATMPTAGASPTIPAPHAAAVAAAHAGSRRLRQRPGQGLRWCRGADLQPDRPRHLDRAQQGHRAGRRLLAARPRLVGFHLGGAAVPRLE